MVVIAIIGLLASVLATSVVSKMRHASHELDKKTLLDLYNHLQMAVMMDEKAKTLLVRGKLSETRGREFLEGCFKTKLLGDDLLKKLISNAGNDVAVDNRWLDDENGALPEYACSWAAPQGNECGAVMRARGSARRVALCLNARNWFNYDDEVLVMWSDAETASYMTLEDSNSWGYAISPEQWQSPGQALFGTTKPFDGVFD